MTPFQTWLIYTVIPGLDTLTHGVIIGGTSLLTITIFLYGMASIVGEEFNERSKTHIKKYGPKIAMLYILALIGSVVIPDKLTLLNMTGVEKLGGGCHYESN